MYVFNVSSNRISNKLNFIFTLNALTYLTFINVYKGKIEYDLSYVLNISPDIL